MSEVVEVDIVNVFRVVVVLTLPPPKSPVG